MSKHSFKTLVLSAPFAIGLLVGVSATGFAASMLGSTVFRDVPSGSFYDSAVGEMYSDGVIKGYPDGTFGPGNYVNRAELAVILQRFRQSLTGQVVTGSSSSSSVRSVSSSSVSTTSSSSSSASSVATPGVAGAIGFTKTAFNIGEASGTFDFVLARTSGSKGQVTVHYTLVPGSATTDDYVNKNETITFKDGETSHTVSIPIIDDKIGENNETFQIVLDSPTGGAVLAANSAATVMILDNDGGCGTSCSSSSSSTSMSGGSSSANSTVNGSLSFSAAAYGVMENGGNLLITVNRNSGTTGAVSVNYVTTDGTAKSGSDYNSTTGTLNFANGETSKTFSIPVIDNTASEGYKTFNVNLALPSGGAILATPSSVPVTIIDNEVVSAGSGTFRLAQPQYSVTESAGTADITIQRAGGVQGTVSVSYNTVGDVASSGTDFTAVSGTVTFAPGESAKIISVPIIKDSVSEGSETFKFVIYGPSQGASLGSPDTSVVTISD